MKGEKRVDDDEEQRNLDTRLCKGYVSAFKTAFKITSDAPGVPDVIKYSDMLAKIGFFYATKQRHTLGLAQKELFRLFCEHVSMYASYRYLLVIAIAFLLPSPSSPLILSRRTVLPTLLGLPFSAPPSSSLPSALFPTPHLIPELPPALQLPTRCSVLVF